MIRIEITTKDPATFLQEYNKARLANKGKWIYFSGEFSGVPLQIKSFNTYIQILKVNDISHNTGMDLKVRGWKYQIGQALSECINS